MSTLQLTAPAKLNLFLHITGQREDGYHNLQTVFQLLDYGDHITLSVRKDGHINRLSALANVSEQNDLTVRAAELLKQKTDTQLGVDISVDKVLPMGGGLGGGSSDAATVLHGCNQLWGTGLTTPELAELGLILGADVPVFVNGYSAWAEGIGDQLTKVELPEKWFVVVRPDVSISTPEIFSDEGLTRNCLAITIRDFLEGHTENVMQDVAEKRYPKLSEALQDLSAFAPAKMTGSGSCIFAEFKSKEDANKVVEILSNKWQSFAAKGVSKSPLLNELSSLT